MRHDDFVERAAEPSAPPVVILSEVATLALIDGGRWCAAPAEGGIVEGVDAELSALVEDTRAGMEARGLLEAGDRVVMSGLAAGSKPFDTLDVTIESARWELARIAITRRYWLKTGLALALFVLIGGAAAVSLAWVRRERQLLALKSDFVATVSHELRTPLASMRLMAETLERRLDRVALARDYPERLIREIDSLSFLVENILSFNRLEKGRWKPQARELLLGELVENLEHELAGATRARVHVSVDGLTDVTVRADPELMRLLFLNLGTNACKYNAEDPVTIRIEALTGSSTRVRIADNGVGIPEEQREKVFSEFYRANESGRGFGLGLAICRRIMELHAGRISVADSSARGTVFELQLPMRDAARILIVEDDENLRLGLADNLDEHGYVVESAVMRRPRGRPWPPVSRSSSSSST